MDSMIIDSIFMIRYLDSDGDEFVKQTTQDEIQSRFGPENHEEQLFEKTFIETSSRKIRIPKGK